MILLYRRSHCEFAHEQLCFFLHYTVTEQSCGGCFPLQQHAEGRAAGGMVAGLDAAVVGVQDFSCDGQAKAGAARAAIGFAD